ncbi:hypothetical protein Mgra_00000779 [Meloidogyne graminicola]|uniref:Uncharacterized protein n=1 Tax=Meloidogyne graminicola TaxID=189291 RepID=A0A8T0A3F6_9BILA|nr:hypothetical protein Mgra_00000779 [Meloidogyne graminicola]
MQVVHHEHSSGRQSTQNHVIILNSTNDIDGTTNRVASVTLESDSLSADQPMSFKNKRRKKIPRKEKMNEMDLDNNNQQKDKLKYVEDNDTCSAENVAKACKMRMDWTEIVPSSSIISSDISTNQSSDVFSDSDEESISDADADDEQSDWPDACKPHFRSISLQQASQHHLHPDFASGDAVLNGQVLKDVQEFLKDSTRNELFLDKVYRTSAIKQILRKETIPVQIVKKGRGTIALKKV